MGKIKSAAICFLFAFRLQGQLVELGPAPRAPFPDNTPVPTQHSRVAGNWYDTSNRASVRDAYNTVFVPSDNIAMGWTGAVAGCVAGTTSAAWKTAVLTRINYFRGMAGVPMSVTLNSTFSGKDQEGAVMFSANKSISHSPPANWLCRTANAVEAAGNSNICYMYGYGNGDPGCIALYMVDSGSGNEIVGHRRWLLYPQTVQMGAGDAAETPAGGYPRGNAIWVFDGNFGGTRPSTRDTYVPWPPKGYVPYQIVPQRWSFAYPGANFGAATVTVMKGGVAQPQTIINATATVYGENSIVWEFPAGFGNPGAQDATYTVTINGVTGAPSSSFTYDVIIIDPANANGGTNAQTTINTNPQGRKVVIDSSQYTAPAIFNWTSGTPHTIDVIPSQVSAGVRSTFLNWTHGGTQSQNISAPASNMVYTANFTIQNQLTTSASPGAGGTVSANPPSADGFYTLGLPVQLTATPNSGYQFSNWTGDVTSNQNPLTVTMDGPKNLVANFTTVASCSYSLSSPSASFTSTGGPGSVNITTTSGCVWSVVNAPAWITINSGASGTGSGTFSYTVTQNSGAARNQTFTVAGQSYGVLQSAPAATVNITVQTSPAGLSFQAAGVNYSSAQVLSLNPGSSLSMSAFTPQSSGGTIQYVFSGWSNGPPTSSQTVIVPSSATTYTANFTTRYKLTLAASPLAGGSISSNPTSGDTFYNAGSVVQLTAIPNSGYLFTSYAGDLSGSTASQNITMSAPRSVTANFTLPSCGYTLSSGSQSFIAAGGSGGFTVNTTSNCTWSVTGAPDWVTITAGANGTGTGLVTFNVSANSSASPRNATLFAGGQQFSITQSAGTITPPSTNGMRFVKMDPCRVMETRAEYNFQGRTGAFGPPSLNAGETRTMTFPASSVCQIPAAAKVYVVNVTLVPHGGVDFVTIWPGGETRPDFWTIRSPDGNIVANSALVKAGANGAVSVYSSSSTDLLIDINGYFTEDTGLSYFPLTPCRVLDTRIDYRSPAGPFGPPTLEAKQTRNFRFPVTPYCAVPTAAAYAITITAVPPGPLQFLTAWPAGAAQPNVSSINSPAGRVLANNVIIPASADGSISTYVFDRSDVIIDITGYFAPDNGQGLLYFPVTQCRVSNTSDGSLTGAFGGPAFADDTARTIPIPSSTRCTGVPSNASAYALNVTAIPNGSPMPFITAWPTGQARPNASILNAFQGQTVTNSAIVPAGTNGSVDIYAYRGTNVVVEIAGYFGR